MVVSRGLHLLYTPILPTRYIILLQRLDDQSGSSTTAIANSNNPDLPFLFPQDVDEGGDNPSSRAAKGVADSHRAAMDVNLCLIKTKNLHVSQGNHGESLVDLISINTRRVNLGVLESLRDS